MNVYDIAAFAKHLLLSQVRLHAYHKHLTNVYPNSYKEATIFFGIGGHEFPKVPGQYFCDPPYLMIKNFMTPLRSYNVEETCNPQCA